MPFIRRSQSRRAFARVVEASDLTSSRLLLVASTGGHLIELHRLVEMWGGAPGALWVTFDTPQSRDLLRGLDVFYVPYVAPRDWKTVVAVASTLRALLRRQRFDGMVSTGAAVALSAALAGLLTGTKMLYVESIARTSGPSLTGRLLQLVPGVALRTQVESWSSSRWRFAGNVLQGYESVPVATAAVPAPMTLFVTLGTIAPYRFDSLVDKALTAIDEDATVTWQVGSTTRSDLPGDVSSAMSYEAVRAAMSRADVIVTHGGVGTILDALDSGKKPVIVPRRRHRGEHVDDHQEEFAALMAASGLAVVVESPDLDGAILSAALKERIRPTSP